MKNTIKQYGKYITVNNMKMNVSIVGNGEKVILLLPGLGSTCPIIEMRAVASFLEDKYTVVTIETFGSGMSDDTHLNRKVETIVGEIHQAMSQLGYKKYSIAGHSISGLYCLLYTTLYHDEVECFIGIDPTPPQAVEVGNTDKMIGRRLRHKYRSTILYKWKTKVIAKRMLKLFKEYKYSDDERNTYAQMCVKAIDSNTIINEMYEAKRNLAYLKDYKYPEDVKVLMLIASYSEIRMPQWNEWHHEISNSAGKIITLKGIHQLHLQIPKTVAKKIDKFISQL